jgi:excinuclease ABC subunit C
MTRSALDDIPGLGETRRKRLLKEIGGVGKVKRATREELRALPWLPDKVADAIHDRFHAVPGPTFVEPEFDGGEIDEAADDTALDDGAFGDAAPPEPEPAEPVEPVGPTAL